MTSSSATAHTTTLEEDELVKRNTDYVYFLASPLTCKKDISWDDLFNYSGVHKDVSGEASLGVNVDIQGSSRAKDKNPLDVVDEDAEGENDEKDDEDEDVGGGDKDEHPKKKDAKYKGGEGGSGAGLDRSDNRYTKGDDDDVDPDFVVHES
ncbi:hypothetical protein L1987_22379 [Smallanthus sonchifolius]|uniref:Uncharacterized protein n=1 Tax=Smallanthus sonchifolius TaxID=185202 RepID=A0ACB9IHD3_9ASTR|nr:hypothetical protein L1987_22379 [Smallanthus sonchifolius]